MKVAIIGTGLIGGSIGLLLQHKGIATCVTGVDHNPDHAQKALTLGLVTEVADLGQAVDQSDLVFLCTPVDVCAALLPAIMNRVDRQVVVDTGSAKGVLTDMLSGHPKRGRYVPTHPMWGTEFSGPVAATVSAFSGKANVICNRADSDADALAMVERLYEQLGMYNVYMDAAAHDLHVAYISHIAHITSFALANTVLEKEREEDAIFRLASAGFESTVRLAKSSPDMWLPVLQQNRDNVLDVLNEHIQQLQDFKICLEQENWEGLYRLMVQANRIRKVLDRRN